MKKATEKRLAQLEREKEQIRAYKAEFRKEFGMTDGELLDALEQIVLDEMTLTLEAANGNLETGRQGIQESMDGKVFGDGIREFITELIKSRK